MYNTANRKSSGTIMKDMLEDELYILHGPKMPPKRKLLRNSPLSYQLLNTECDFRSLSLGDTLFVVRKEFLTVIVEEKNVPCVIIF